MRPVACVDWLTQRTNSEKVTNIITAALESLYIPILNVYILMM
jgi:hypothetical protein